MEDSTDDIVYIAPTPEWFIDKSRDGSLSPSQQQMWLLTGQTLYPSHCPLNLTLYTWHLNNSLLSVAADEFSKILKEFSDNPILISHLTALIATVNSGSNSTEVEVLRSLSLAEQQGVYLTVATSQHDKLACTSTVLQMMRAYPSSIAQHAISAAKVLIKHEQQQGAKLGGSINPLRRMLILELMPMILSKGTEFLDTLTETVVMLFVQLIAHYYIECAAVTGPAIKEQYKITDPWSDLRSNLLKFSKLHNWNMLPDFQSCSTASLLKNIEEATSTVSSDPGLFYCLLFAMFEHSFKYTKAVDTYSLILAKSTDNPTPTSTAPDPPEEEQPRKRRRTLSITECSSSVINSFNIANISYQYMKKNMARQLNSVCEELNAPSWRWYSLFLVDQALYNSDSNLSSIQSRHAADHRSDQVRILTQQALSISNPTSTFKSLWSLLDSLPASTETTFPALVSDIVISKHDTSFTFVVNSRPKLCLHICRTLVNMVSGRICKTRQSDLLALLLIIYQYDVNLFEGELEKTITAVQSVKTFKYKGLLSHVTEVVLLEELLFLANKTEVRLDILGDNKKRYNQDEVVREITNHVQHCKDSSEAGVMRFISDHRELIETKFGQFAFATT